ncbi:hypothetical protein H8356DRAFT_1357355 [Neocallimastix lanati (nom. inval.)]|nr:hypothetical protein H8356DRAFT_1357355 [Neocallimastix sp. JGI-2020a]
MVIPLNLLNLPLLKLSDTDSVDNTNTEIITCNNGHGIIIDEWEKLETYCFYLSLDSEKDYDNDNNNNNNNNNNIYYYKLKIYFKNVTSRQYQEEATARNALRDTTSKFNFYNREENTLS